MRRKLTALWCAICCIIVLFLHQDFINQYGYPMYNHYITMAYLETSSTNVVTAIYLFYRYYDTIFESLMLLFGIIAVIYLSVHEGGEHYE